MQHFNATLAWQTNKTRRWCCSERACIRNDDFHTCNMHMVGFSVQPQLKSFSRSTRCQKRSPLCVARADWQKQHPMNPTNRKRNSLIADPAAVTDSLSQINIKYIPFDVIIIILCFSVCSTVGYLLTMTHYICRSSALKMAFCARNQHESNRI